MNSEQINKIKQAGQIASEVVKYAKSIIKKDSSLLEIADKIESKIYELGGKPAFPVNLSINEIAAHSTPSFNDESRANGLLKTDIGVHISGFVADTAFSLDLENNEENKNLIKAAEESLQNALNEIAFGKKLRDIGSIIERTMKSHNTQPIINLSGHSISRYELHSGLTIPNYDNMKEKTLDEGLYAIEPFSTNGFGNVKDSKPSGIYHLEHFGNVRDSFAREVLQYIKEEYNTLPFCTRWLHKKFGSRVLIALRQMEQAGILHHYAQLVEQGKGKVAQAEHTVIITKDEKIITTK